MVLYFMFQMLTQAPMLILSFNMPKSQCSGCCKFVAFDSEITKLAMCQDSKSISADGNICVAAFDSTCSGICRSADPIVEVNMKCVDLEIIIWKLKTIVNEYEKNTKQMMKNDSSKLVATQS
ncbi:hypothetical protein YC2023_099640 [Brassica napus]